MFPNRRKVWSQIRRQTWRLLCYQRWSATSWVARHDHKLRIL